jgi:hypothetical protein
MENATNEVAKAKRPGLVTVLCILTFIGSGLGTLVYLLLLIAAGSLGAMLADIPGVGSMIAGGGMAIFGASFVLSFASLFGAIKMWGMKKMGFFIYAIAQVLLLILPLFLGVPFTIMPLVFTALFIVLYGINLKHMS